MRNAALFTALILALNSSPIALFFNSVRYFDYLVILGYCGHNYTGDALVHIAVRGTKKLKASVRKWIKRRSAIEAVIGHAKTDGRLGRNYLHGREGDKINAILSGCGYNIRKLLKALLFCLFFCRKRPLSTV
ncbi:MAG: hypothetical protein H8D23_00645 [Candidatus Brocadiales bacterium]|nr:hypothetical protein [Candidatus Brocadiales bacterium]